MPKKEPLSLQAGQRMVEALFAGECVGNTSLNSWAIVLTTKSGIVLEFFYHEHLGPDPMSPRKVKDESYYVAVARDEDGEEVKRTLGFNQLSGAIKAIMVGYYVDALARRFL